MKKSFSSALVLSSFVLLLVLAAAPTQAMRARGENGSGNAEIGGAAMKAVPAQVEPMPAQNGMGMDDETNLEIRQQQQLNNPEMGAMVQERQEVREEVKTQLQERLKTQEQVRDLGVGQDKAMLRGGANFSLNEEGLVTVVTPSGNEHMLNNLPDTAIEKMTAAGVIDAASSSGEAAVELEVTPEERVVYRRSDVMEKKFLGIFPRSVKSEVILDDESGEVSEVPVASSSFFQRLLDRLSF